MRHLKKIFLSAGVIFFLSFSLYAQNRMEAVMNVSVNVVSGATVEQPAVVKEPLHTGTVSLSQIKPAKISVVPNTDVQIESSNELQLVNEFDESLLVAATSQIDEDTSDGDCSISFGAVLNCPPNLRGNYQGTYNTRVEYF